MNVNSPKLTLCEFHTKEIIKSKLLLSFIKNARNSTVFISKMGWVDFVKWRVV